MDLVEEQREFQRSMANEEREWRTEERLRAQNAQKTTVIVTLFVAVVGFVGALSAVALARLLANWPIAP